MAIVYDPDKGGRPLKGAAEGLAAAGRWRSGLADATVDLRRGPTLTHTQSGPSGLGKPHRPPNCRQRVGAADARTKGALVGIVVVVVLLLVVMPLLIYFAGWSVTRYTRKAPSWIAFPSREPPGRDRADAAAPPRLKA
jgi:hypothetical protein